MLENDDFIGKAHIVKWITRQVAFKKYKEIVTMMKIAAANDLIDAAQLKVVTGHKSSLKLQLLLEMALRGLTRSHGVKGSSGS